MARFHANSEEGLWYEGCPVTKYEEWYNKKRLSNVIFFTWHLFELRLCCKLSAVIEHIEGNQHTKSLRTANDQLYTDKQDDIESRTYDLLDHHRLRLGLDLRSHSFLSHRVAP